MSRQGKQVLSQPQPDKTRWDENSLDAFVDICVETIQSITRTPGSPVPKFEWERIATKFKTRTGLAYTKKALKNKWDQLKKEWTLWTRMTQNETRLGWDGVNRRAVMSEDWWEIKIKENKEYARFKKQGFRYLDQLRYCFTRGGGGGVSTCKYFVTPFSGHNPVLKPTEEELPEIDRFAEGDDVYRPETVGLESLGIDTEPEKSTASLPTENDFSTPISRKAYTTPNTGDFSSPPPSKSIGKRAALQKRGVSKKWKSAAQSVEDRESSTGIANALEAQVHYNASKLRAASVSAAAPPAPFNVAITILNDMVKGSELSTEIYFFALEELLNPRFTNILVSMLPAYRRDYIIKKYNANGL